MDHEEKRNADTTAQAEAAANTAEPTTLPEQDKLAELEKQAQGYLEGWQRERAEFANYKRRTERELKDSAQNAAVDLLKNFLPIIDDFERAMSSVPAELQDDPWLNGITMIQRKFQKLLEDQGVSVIDPAGQPFDPTRHEAVGMDGDSAVESGHVTAVLQKGYAYGDRVLRPALVRVAG